MDENKATQVVMENMSTFLKDGRRWIYRSFAANCIDLMVEDIGGDVLKNEIGGGELGATQFGTDE